eukprot:comp19660_c0_seq1/m.23281 comp19660_c0_seq1/g.23281  ORF comp19660_c0_seq1/g.23281 comp19660_c0_seq1/m.23281 type:complete len:392 (-) comp19660_c0_seq1:203-1378(-)
MSESADDLPKVGAMNNYSNIDEDEVYFPEDDLSTPGSYEGSATGEHEKKRKRRRTLAELKREGFVCKHCQKPYASRRSLYQHIRKMHKLQRPPIVNRRRALRDPKINIREPQDATVIPPTTNEDLYQASGSPAPVSNMVGYTINPDPLTTLMLGLLDDDQVEQLAGHPEFAQVTVTKGTKIFPAILKIAVVLKYDWSTEHMRACADDLASLGCVVVGDLRDVNMRSCQTPDLFPVAILRELRALFLEVEKPPKTPKSGQNPARPAHVLKDANKIVVKFLKQIVDPPEDLQDFAIPDGVFVSSTGMLELMKKWCERTGRSHKYCSSKRLGVILKLTGGERYKKKVGSLYVAATGDIQPQPFQGEENEIDHEYVHCHRICHEKIRELRVVRSK